MNAEEMTHTDVRKDLRSMAKSEIADHSAHFFKSGPGEYAEGDRFLGVRVPEQRKIAKKFQSLSLEEVARLLKSEFHEERLTALFILVLKYKRASEGIKKEIFDLYLDNWVFVNNWDLVDSSAHQIVGAYLEDRPRELLYELAMSGHLWKKRISIIATYHFIKMGQLDDTFAVADLLLENSHDLIHKAVGWMLREAWKKRPDETELFLKSRYRGMPRTMLRYAIEKFPERKRQAYLNGSVV